MKKYFLIVSIAVAFILPSCQNASKSADPNSQHSVDTLKQQEAQLINVSYTVAKNYFVKNTVKKLDDPKIETAEKFNEVFGMATTMRSDGKPTDIDFSKDYVIAILLPETDMATQLNPMSLQKNEKGDIILTYRNVVGEIQSFTTIPNFAIIVDKSSNGNIILKETK